MALMTGEEYIESIGKMKVQVYMFGKRWSVRWTIRSCGRV